MDVLELVSFVQWDVVFSERGFEMEVEDTALYTARGLGVTVHVG